jgi:NAD(P)-dependent dehydrogenase (short-subunit alcohol dehydrogenase family)
MTDAPLMAGTYVPVTRGTGGIGKATVAGLAALGVRVGITGRDQGRAAAAAADTRGWRGTCSSSRGVPGWRVDHELTQKGVR